MRTTEAMNAQPWRRWPLTWSVNLQEIAAVKDDAEQDLAAAKPALDSAVEALNSITPKDITSLKALKNPPDVVKRIFDAVLLLRCVSHGTAACSCMPKGRRS